MTDPNKLQFDDETHTYRLGSRIVPNVTSVLAPNVDFSMIPGDVLQHAMERGTAVHRACELHLLDDLDESSLDSEVRPYFWQFLKFLLQATFHVEHTERRVYSTRYRYAGTLDLFGTLGRKTCLIDIKTPIRIHPITGPQTAAYEAALREEDKLPARKRIHRYALKLQPDRYELVAFNDPADFGVYLANLTIHQWRMKHAKR